MHKYRWIALLLCFALLLSGCSPVDLLQQALYGDQQSPFSEIIETLTGIPAPVAFSDMPYVHPDEAALQENFDTATTAAAEKNVPALMGALDTASLAYRDFHTHHTIAMIRSDSDQTNTYWLEEYAWCERLSAKVEQWMEQMLQACALSPLRSRLEREGYFLPHELDAYEDSDSFNDEMVALYQRESELISAYRELCADPTITLDGTSVQLNEYLAREDVPEEEQEQAYLAYMQQINGEVAELYCELILLRREMAEVAGYTDYEAFQYDYYGRSYTPEDVADYLADIRELLGPYRQTLVTQGEYDARTYPAMTEDKLLSTLKKVMEELGADAANVLDRMLELELYNVTPSLNKAPISYTAYLPSYETPYLFVDTYGDVEDVLYTSHEFGHFLAAWMYGYGVASLDLDETYSQGMEYLTLCHLESILSESEYEALLRIKLLDTLDTYTTQGAFASFEQAVYALPEEELNAETLNALSLSCMQDYGCVDGDEEFCSLYWSQVTHLFEMPFYVLSYCVSVDSAMQIYQKELTQAGSGRDAYFALLDFPEMLFPEELETVDLESPLTEGRVEQALELMKSQLPPHTE